MLEVTNTPWGERHWYVLDARGDTTTTTTAKAMHVSPFLPMDLDYEVSWRERPIADFACAPIKSVAGPSQF